MHSASLLCPMLASLFLASASAGAVTLDFEDRPPANDSMLTLGDEYVDLGVRFLTDDAATWGGLAADDPGAWRLEGTHGSTFLGFDGRSYTATLQFDTPVSDFQLDVARADGTPPGFDFLIVAGLLQGVVVDDAMVFLGAVDDWQSIALTGEVDSVLIFGAGLPGYRFGVDAIRWTDGVEQVLEVDVDIRPGSVDNPIQVGSRGVVPVVLYGSANLDVLEIDPSTCVFGPAEAAIAHRNGPHFVDRDGDGWLDVLLHHRLEEAELRSDDLVACVRGSTFDGVRFEGCDAVLPVASGRYGVPR